jgi:hypothetical protein
MIFEVGAMQFMIVMRTSSNFYTARRAPRIKFQFFTYCKLFFSIFEFSTLKILRVNSPRVEIYF